MKNTVLPLTPKEAAKLVADGTQLHELPKSERHGNRPGHGREFYQLDEDCANLVEDAETGARVCAKYDERPEVCREFKEGGFNCLSFRAARLPESSVQVIESGPTHIESLAS